jgi:hypothetical protein
MEIQTTYDQKTLTAMAKVLRKTTRKKKNIAVRIFGWAVILFYVLLELSLFLMGEFVLNGRTAITLLAVLLILLAILLEDRLNGLEASRRMLPGTQEARAVFSDTEYTVTTQAAETHWKYQKLQKACETKEYFVFLFDQNHAQAFAKAGFAQGTPDELRTFIQEKTGKPVEYVR